MATVTQGGRTTETKRSVGETPVVTLSEVIEAEKDVELPVIYVSTEGKDRAWIEAPEPEYDRVTGRLIRNDPGLQIEFTNGVAPPLYASKPSHARTIERLDNAIKQQYDVVEVLGLKRMEPGQPLPPLNKWDGLGKDTIRVALEANFTDNFEHNRRVLESGVRYELSKPKKDQRKDVIAMLEALVQVAAAESDSVDALDVEV